MYIQDLILKYPDILTNDEQDKVNTIKDIMLFGVTAGIFAIPYSVYLGMKARKNPTLRSQYIRRMAFLPTVPLLIVLVGGYYADKNFKNLS
jgi:hypothetical protein